MRVKIGKVKCDPAYSDHPNTKDTTWYNIGETQRTQSGTILEVILPARARVPNLPIDKHIKRVYKHEAQNAAPSLVVVVVLLIPAGVGSPLNIMMSPVDCCSHISHPVHQVPQCPM